MADAPAAAVPAAAPTNPRAPAASSPAQPQRREINVSAIPAPAEPAAPPKKGSLKEGILKNLRDRAKPDPTGEPSEPQPPAIQPKEPIKETPEGGEPAAPAATPAATPDDPKKPKVSPWKLVEEYKGKLAKAEADLLESNKRAIPESKWKEHEETLAQKEKRLNELEEEIRYVNYSKSSEFKDKYQVPYEKAWTRAMTELGEIKIETGNGQTRPMAAADLLELVNLPLQKAHELAEEQFGPLAGEVMAHRKEIKKLFDDQSVALDEARTKGSEREKTQTAEQQRAFGELSGTIKDTWAKANEEVVADPKYSVYFTPKDGDEQGNQRLSKGFELADRAFSENPLAPGLSTEQRQAIVRRHAAVRNRAAAFGKLVFMNTQANQRIAELETQLKEYKESSPEARGSQPAASAPAKKSGMAGVLDDLRKRAK